MATKSEIEQSLIDATIEELIHNKLQQWIFLRAAIATSPAWGIKSGAVLLLYLGKDAFRIVRPSNETVQSYTSVESLERELAENSKWDDSGRKLIKLIIELTEVLFVESFGKDIERRIKELEKIKDVIL